jgi:hypothetical protein
VRDDLVEDVVNPDAMDWTPTDPSIHHNTSTSKSRCTQNVTPEPECDGLWLRPQRFFPPEQPTGLETLFAQTKLSTDNDANGHTRRQRIWNWAWVYGMSLIPLAGVAFKAWENTNANKLTR